MGTFTPTELRELVDSPNETLGVEYKTWLDLADATVRADLARHVAAMANHGGGKIVLGISDDMASVGANPFVDTACNRDLIASIVKKHLEPPFQCDVHLVTSAGGTVHPVIVVPPHGSSPICAKAGGPQINGKQSGISQGTYYTRKAGPESAPILTPAEWAPIIRRCAMHERSAIIGALDLAIRGVSAPEPSAVDTLKTWHDAAYAAFLKDVWRAPDFANWGTSNFQYSYSIDRSDRQELLCMAVRN
jgi:hypothetical protein